MFIKKYNKIISLLHRLFFLLLALLLGLSVSLAAAQTAALALTVDVHVPQGIYYVGQAIELRIGIESERGRPKVTTPRVLDAEVTALRTELIQRGATGIGDFVTERIYYVFPFRIVAKQPGVLQIPPVTARLGERSGTSAPLQVMVRALPAAGRPASFLGGVGRLSVDALAHPGTIHAGQDFEYRIRLFGPAARGSTLPPDLTGFDRLSIAAETQPLPVEVVADPPSRVFRYRVRPTRAGETVLPPIAISYFEPKGGHYLTKTTPGVPVLVVDVATFDPNSFAYASLNLGTDSNAPEKTHQEALWPAGVWWSGLRIAISVSLIAFSLAAGALLVIKGAHWRKADPGRFARVVARHLDSTQGADAAATRITAELAGYLRRAAGRPEGVLTPLEAHRAFEQLAGDCWLGERADRLVAACDQVRYSGRGGSAEALVADARPLFADLGRSVVIRGDDLSAEKHHGRHPKPPLGDGYGLPPDDEQAYSTYLR
jgi:hypothetical protein